MTSRADFTEAEWERLGRAPLVAGMAISLADPGGPVETIRESTAALQTLLEAAKDGGHGGFVQAVARDVAAKAQRRENPMAGFHPDRSTALDEILDELRAVNALLLRKADAREVGEFRAWLRAASQRAALAAKEGGFLGIGGKLVSEREQQMLDTLGEIFGAPPPSAEPAFEGTEHTIDATRIHHRWDRTLEPALRIASGDVVHFDLLMAGHGQVREGASFAEATFDPTTLPQLLGPVLVEDAEPGDTLRVDVLALEPGDWGWASIQPGRGLLADDFPEGVLRTFDLRDETVEAAPGIHVPTAPFLGTMGAHPGEPAVAEVLPPHRGGGNVDTRHLTVGSSLFVPVWCEGALFSCGDPHALQGDGEVCVSAVECDMRATLRLSVEKRTIPGPQFVTAGPLPAVDESAGHFGAMGLHTDLMEGARTAVRSAIDWLGAEHGLSAADAYILCSLAGDLKILAIADAGVWNVGFTLPLSIFPPR